MQYIKKSENIFETFQCTWSLNRYIIFWRICFMDVDSACL